VQMSALQGISGGKEAVIKMLAFAEKPSAIFACNDLTAIGALHGIRQIGLQVPEDIAVIGFDNIEVAEYLEVPLTTVGQPKTEMGKIGAKLIIDQIQGRSPELHKVSLQPKLIVRQSCGSLVMARRRAGA
ncbi:MAG: substrate-binding domain-containing protein, partial [Firmicutes bacterium]|nr:substrate-binding domain-containing protein [Bacillota bacterium]